LPVAKNRKSFGCVRDWPKFWATFAMTRPRILSGLAATKQLVNHKGQQMDSAAYSTSTAYSRRKETSTVSSPGAPAGPLAIEIGPTKDFHTAVAERLQGDNGRLPAALHAANDRLIGQHLLFAGKKQFTAALTALLLDRTDWRRITMLADKTHDFVERIAARLAADETLLDRYFPDHRRVLPFLSGTRGSAARQVVSRYDVAVRPDGGLRVMELNTGCPGGLMVAEAVTQTVHQMFDSLGGDLSLAGASSGTVSPTALIDGLLAVEERAGIEPGVMAVLNDENRLVFELDLIAAALADRGRKAIVAQAEDLNFDG